MEENKKNSNCECGENHENCDCDHDNHNHEDCNCDHDHHNHEEVETIYLTLEDGKELECMVLAYMEVKDKEYVALLPEEDERVLLYQYEETEEGLELITIDDDDEFELVSQAYMEIFGEFEEEEE